MPPAHKILLYTAETHRMRVLSSVELRPSFDFAMEPQFVTPLTEMHVHKFCTLTSGAFAAEQGI